MCNRESCLLSMDGCTCENSNTEKCLCTSLICHCGKSKDKPIYIGDGVVDWSNSDDGSWKGYICPNEGCFNTLRSGYNICWSCTKSNSANNKKYRCPICQFLGSKVYFSNYKGNCNRYWCKRCYNSR